MRGCRWSLPRCRRNRELQAPPADFPGGGVLPDGGYSATAAVGIPPGLRQQCARLLTVARRDAVTPRPKVNAKWLN